MTTYNLGYLNAHHEDLDTSFKFPIKLIETQDGIYVEITLLSDIAFKSGPYPSWTDACNALDSILLSFENLEFYNFEKGSDYNEYLRTLENIIIPFEL